MSGLLETVGTFIDGAWAWVMTTLTNIESALEASLILQIVLGVAAITLGFYLVRKIVNVIKGLIRK
jgi:hypothetical protein